MKKRLILGIIVSAIIMMIAPFIFIIFPDSGETGMVIMLMLLYYGYPAYSVIIGILAGIDYKHLWSLPIISSALFQIWIWISGGDIYTCVFTVVYLGCGLCALLISSFISIIVRKIIYK